MTFPNERIEMITPDHLEPWAKNTRTHSKKQLKQLETSIETFGFTNPVLIDNTNIILAGHGRVQAAILLGLDKVPCIRLGHMTQEQKRAYVIADNKLALMRVGMKICWRKSWGSFSIWIWALILE